MSGLSPTRTGQVLRHKPAASVLLQGLSAVQRAVDNERLDRNPVHKIVDNLGDNVAGWQGRSGGAVSWRRATATGRRTGGAGDPAPPGGRLGRPGVRGTPPGDL